MEEFPIIAIAWLIHAIPGALLATPFIIWGGKRVRWRVWESLAFVVPFGVWMALTLSEASTGVKTLSNFVVEPLLLGGLVVLGAIVRVRIRPTSKESRMAAFVLTGLTFAAALLFFLTPALPE